MIRAYATGLAVLVAISAGLAGALRLFDASPLAGLPEGLQGLAFIAMTGALALLLFLLWRGVKSL